MILSIESVLILVRTFLSTSVVIVKMENIFDLGKVPYEAAPPSKQFTVWDYIALILAVLLDFARVLILSIPNDLLSIFHWLIRPAMKSVHGQTALVSLIVQ